MLVLKSVMKANFQSEILEETVTQTEPLDPQLMLMSVQSVAKQDLSTSQVLLVLEHVQMEPTEMWLTITEMHETPQVHSEQPVQEIIILVHLASKLQLFIYCMELLV